MATLPDLSWSQCGLIMTLDWYGDGFIKCWATGLPECSTTSCSTSGKYFDNSSAVAPCDCWHEDRWWTIVICRFLHRKWIQKETDHGNSLSVLWPKEVLEALDQSVYARSSHLVCGRVPSQQLQARASIRNMNIPLEIKQMPLHLEWLHVYLPLNVTLDIPSLNV